MDADRKFAHIRALSEPYILSLSELLLFDLPSWVPAADALDDWEASGWELGTPPSID